MQKEMNARIRIAEISQQRGCWVLDLGFEGDGWGQGLGGFVLDNPVKDENGKFLRREGTAQGMQAIMDLCSVFEVSSFEKLKGMPVRIRRDSEDWNARIIAVGHFMKDRWWEPWAKKRELSQDQKA